MKIIRENRESELSTSKLVAWGLDLTINCSVAPHHHDVFYKLHAWSLTWYERMRAITTERRQLQVLFCRRLSPHPVNNVRKDRNNVTIHSRNNHNVIKKAPSLVINLETNEEIRAIWSAAGPEMLAVRCKVPIGIESVVPTLMRLNTSNKIVHEWII